MSRYIIAKGLTENLVMWLNYPQYIWFSLFFICILSIKDNFSEECLDASDPFVDLTIDWEICPPHHFRFASVMWLKNPPANIQTHARVRSNYTLL